MKSFAVRSLRRLLIFFNFHFACIVLLPELQKFALEIYLLNKPPLLHLCEAKCDTDKLLWSGTCSGVVISPALQVECIKGKALKM